MTDKPERLVGEVLSFATGAANLVPVEQDAGHFLYGLKRLSMRGMAVIQEPPDEAPTRTFDSLHRVQRWLRDEDVQVVKPEDLEAPAEQQLVLT